MDNNTVYEWILNTTFTVSERTQDLQCLEPHLSRLIRPGDRVLDLCCGSGPMSFWFEGQGAKTTGVDFAPYMIALAKAEASRRNSAVEFFQADIFTLDFGRECFDLIVCFGNSISDFPLADFARLGRKIASALTPGGRFILDYHDGSYEYMLGIKARQGVYQEFPERITFRYKEYLSEIGANVHTIRNETRGEEYDRKAYLYAMPVIHLALSDRFSREQHIILGENHFLDVFVRKADQE